jgi:hypothetical protein
MHDHVAERRRFERCGHLSRPADNITKLVYANSYFGAFTSLAFSGSNQVLISVSGATGQITTVAPFAGAKPATAKPMVQGTHLVYSANFTALYNRAGQNVAPSGAKEVEIDPKTGLLVSWR